MPFLAKLIEILSFETETPKLYGAFHISFVVLATLATFLLCRFFKDTSDRTYRRIILICWITIVVLELYKQLVFTFEVSEGTIISDYQWYAFPYQLCSTPLYVMPLVAFLPNGRVRDAAMSFLATFAFFGGLVVFLYPGDVFIPILGVSIQTMVHHGMQIVIGIYTAVYNRKRYNFKFFLHAVPAFAVLVTLAFLMNIGVYHAFAAAGIDETFNMFYIGPYFPCTLPVLGDIVWPNVHYAAFLAIYVLGFCLVAYVMYVIQHGIMRLGGTRVKN